MIHPLRALIPKEMGLKISDGWIVENLSCNRSVA